jgi:outer membrane protein OmpA-like peptidoglycan-associated protein
MIHQKLLNRTLFLLMLFVSLWSNTQAQIDVRKNMREADAYFKVYEYSTALEWYESVYNQNSEDIRANFQIGLCHLKMTDKKKALPFLQKAQSLNPTHSPLLEFYLAEAFKYNNQPDESTHYYEYAYEKMTNVNGNITVYNEEIKSKDFLQLIRQRIQEAKLGVRFLTDPTNARVRNIGENINSEYSEYAPVISGDESILIFTSRRKGTTGGGRSPEDNLYYEDLYIADKKRDEWAKPKNIGSNINSKYHEASVALSPDGKQLFIYQDSNGGDIYVSELKERNNWSIPQKLGGKINSKYREASVSITSDGNTLYFSSDRPDENAQGGLDIYRVDKKENGSWGDPINLGSEINTAEDEDAPFIHYDAKTLYFSSRGHQTMGGYDIFYTEFIDGNWTQPVNLGYPINTAEDDIHFVLSADYKRGYYASDQKEGYGDKDIYIVDMPDYRDVEVIDFQLSLKTISVGFDPLTTNDPKRAIVILRGIVKDEESDQLISARMSLIDVEENQVVNEIDAVAPSGVYYTQMKTGRKYLLHVQKEGYLYHSEYFEIPVGVVNQEKILNIYLKRINVKKSIDFKALFNYNSATLTKQSIPALQNLLAFLNTNPDIRGQIEGHTDNIGTEERNAILSENRAKSVYDYLILQGIDKNRLSFMGYGELEPIASNDTPHGRTLNRRTEFKILQINN